MSYNYIDLFSGAGGLSLGLKWSKFNCLFASDFDKQIAETYKRNFTKTPFVCDDIRNIDFSNVKKDLKIKKNDVDLIVGGPPCQGFSMANRKRIEEDPRNLLFRNFIRAVETFNPKCFLIENVTGLNSENISLRTKEKPVTEVISDYFKRIGYQIKITSFKSEEHNLPQFRRRVLIIGTNILKKKNPLLHNEIGVLRGSYSSYEYMKKENEEQMSFFESKKKPVTVWESISDLPKIKAGENGDHLDYVSSPINNYQKKMRNKSKGVTNHISTPHDEMALKRIKLIKQGQNFTSLPKELKTKSVHSGAWGRLEADGLAPTITTRFDTPSVGRVIHPFDHRTITVREAARIQSFPDHFKFYGTRTSQGIQVGNSVPPLVAKAIGQMFIKDFFS